MATRTEASTVYAAGLVQGIVLVTFPAASTIFTDPAQYDLSSTQYGTMFLPQVVTAITASRSAEPWLAVSAPSASTWSACWPTWSRWRCSLSASSSPATRSHTGCS